MNLVAQKAKAGKLEQVGKVDAVSPPTGHNVIDLTELLK